CSMSVTSCAALSALSLPDALPISDRICPGREVPRALGLPAEPAALAFIVEVAAHAPPRHPLAEHVLVAVRGRVPGLVRGHVPVRSEEHTSELQSRENLVCRLLLEK